MEKLYFDSVGKYNEVYGLLTRHPLVRAIDLRDGIKYANHVEIQGDIYGLYLKNIPYCSLKYGRKNYDFQAGTVVSIVRPVASKILPASAHRPSEPPL